MAYLCSDGLFTPVASRLQHEKKWSWCLNVKKESSHMIIQRQKQVKSGCRKKLLVTLKFIADYLHLKDQITRPWGSQLHSYQFVFSNKLRPLLLFNHSNEELQKLTHWSIYHRKRISTNWKTCRDKVNTFGKILTMKIQIKSLKKENWVVEI